MKYAALFRGINVGGKNIVKMAQLRQLFIDLGFADVQTYIQSGNVVFCSDAEPSAVIAKIRTGFSAAFGFDSALTLRTADELAAILSGLPFAPEELSEAEAANPIVEHLYVYLLDGAPEPSALERLIDGYTGPDKLRTGKRELYLLCHASVRDSKLAASLAKQKTPMTARNWKTMNKLYEIMKPGNPV